MCIGVYGIELSDISSEQDNGKFVPSWKQESVIKMVYTRRLHGAFKRGRSAGYYKTIGPKEGKT
ncbi:21406_t:CDS:2 [Entrophospora sp. SA101]|nr:21406_t:CDS:2 [Entrophospora sp. SA101]CAJ0825745.1 5404_t:CDS:2 [Entrophospora sp. SA101]CAJ0840197.1 2275_t:CDS:2 [Entrophospora sp. SA101]